MKRLLIIPLCLSLFLALTLGLQNCKKTEPDPVKPGTGTTTPGSGTTTPGSGTTTSGSGTTTTTTAPGFNSATAPTTSGITSASATVSAVLDGNGGATISQHGFVYSKTAQTPTLTDSKLELGATTGPFPLTLTGKLTGLDANTTYYVRAFATNDKGTGYGVTVQFKTVEIPIVSTNPDDAETIYIGAYYTTYAFDAATGRQKGEYSITGGSANAAPAIANGVMYIGSNSILAYDASTRRRVWEYVGLGDLNGLSSDLTVDNGILYAPTEKKLFAIEAATSIKKWEFTATGNNPLTSPVLIGGMVYLVGGVGMYALDAATGTRKWTYQAGLQTGATISEGIAFATGAPNTLHAVDIATGTKKWSYQMGTTFGSLGSFATVVNNTVYVGSGDKKLYAVDATTGAKKWDFLTGGDVYSSPTVANGLVFFFSSDANLYAVDAATGTKKWNVRIGTTGKVLGSTSPVVVSGVVYATGESRTAYAFDAASGVEKWRVVTAENLTSSPTVVAKNGKVYYSSRSGAQQ